jgi:nucleoside-triphosphatase THEP1
MSIYIFSRPIHSGKTTELLQWCDQQKNIMGVAMPDMNGSRKILDMHTKEVFDIECTDMANTTETLISVGRFHFYLSAFEKVNSIILNSLSQDPDWLVIDEAGKLELDGKGFYDSLTAAAVYYNNKKNRGNLLITVRESLCTKVIKFFNLRGCISIYQLDELV